MPSFSDRSEKRLMTCDSRLIEIFAELVKIYDCSIVCGHRNAKDQNAAFESNNSKVKWPDSKHNSYPSLGVDVVPYPSLWDSGEQFYFMAGMVFMIAQRKGIKIRWGGDWDRDGDFNDQKFMDLGHFEIVEQDQEK